MVYRTAAGDGPASISAAHACGTQDVIDTPGELGASTDTSFATANSVPSSSITCFDAGNGMAWCAWRGFRRCYLTVQ